MPKTPEQITELNQKAAETAMKLTQVSIAQGERLLKLQLDIMHGMLDDSMKAAKALTEARDPQQWGMLQERNLRDMLVRLMDYSHNIQKLAGKTQQEVGGVMENRLHAMNGQFQDMVDDMAKAAPPGSEAAFAGIKQTLTAVNDMVDTMTKTAQQFAHAAESALNAVAETAIKSGKPGKGGKGGKAG